MEGVLTILLGNLKLLTRLLDLLVQDFELLFAQRIRLGVLFHVDLRSKQASKQIDPSPPSNPASKQQPSNRVIISVVSHASDVIIPVVSEQTRNQIRKGVITRNIIAIDDAAWHRSCAHLELL